MLKLFISVPSVFYILSKLVCERMLVLCACLYVWAHLACVFPTFLHTTRQPISIASLCRDFLSAYLLFHSGIINESWVHFGSQESISQMSSQLGLHMEYLTWTCGQSIRSTISFLSFSPCLHPNFVSLTCFSYLTLSVFSMQMPLFFPHSVYTDGASDVCKKDPISLFAHFCLTVFCF